MRETPVIAFNVNEPESFGNLAEKLDVGTRRTFAVDLIELIAIDERSMADWVAEAKGYLETLENGRGNEMPQNREQEGSGEERPPGTEMTLTAVIQFAANATDALLGEPDLAKASAEGAEPLASWVSAEVRTRDPNWILDTDPLVVHMAVTGLAWRKRSFDEIDRAFHSYFLTCTEVIINSNVRSVERAPRITHEFERYPYEIERSIQRKHWIDYEPMYDEADPEAPKRFYECDLWIDLDGDGISEPWTIVVSRDDTPEVIKIAPRWSRKTVVNSSEKLYFNPVHRYYPYRFLPDPKGGFLPMGFGKLLHRVQSSADRLLASIVDTAETEAENGGVLAGGGFGLPDKMELKQNRVTTLNTDGAPLANRFTMFPAKQVSPGSVQVLEKILTLGDRVAGTLNLLENAPASMTATLARGIIDTGTKVQSAVHRRLVSMMTREFHQLVRMADAYSMLPRELSASDAGSVAVTADPQLATEMQRSALANVYMELMQDPLTKWDEIRLRLYRTLRLPQPEALLGSPPTPQATPFEKIQGAVHLMKQRTEQIKTIGGVAVQLTQALKNLVDANGGMVDNQAALLQMAQLEYAVQQLMQGAQDAGNSINELGSMAGQPGNQSPPGLPAPQAGANGGEVPGGQSGGPG
ncbi:MAG: hypothetical protein AAGL98_00030 [Planctomycetota bacterium]